MTCIGTDHAPHSAEDKAKGAAGMVGLETAFAVCYTKLCRMEGLPLEMLSFLMSSGPAQVLGLDEHKGRLVPGFDADIVLVDTDHMFTVHADELHSKSKNCPYDGESFYPGQIVPCSVVDTMGAGDSFIAGFLMAWLKKEPIPACMRAGAENAAVTLGYPGAW